MNLKTLIQRLQPTEPDPSDKCPKDEVEGLERELESRMTNHSQEVDVVDLPLWVQG